MKRIIAFGLGLALFLGSIAQLPAGPAAAEEPRSGTSLQYGDQGEYVAVIQRQLAALGYYSGKVSGNFLDGTRAAVTKFQKDYNLKETGVVDGETEVVLMGAEYRSLRMNSSGDDVKRVQEHLSKLGYYKGRVSGNYLEGTTAAIHAFQEQNGLEGTGVADVSTQKLLFSGNALAKDAVASTLDPEMDVGDINDVVMVADGADNEASLEKAEYAQKLRRGAKGANVKLVQQRLTELGYFNGPVSGNYMNKTVDAVKRFQEVNGLKNDGVTGEETWKTLFSAEDALDASATPRPTPVPTPVPYAITVDVRNQAVIVYGQDEKGEYTVPVRRMVCSTGTKATPSDVGEWVLDGRKARWCYFSLYGSHAQYWTRINKYIAFHSVIYRSVNLMNMSVKSYEMLGSRASRGCIRLLVSEAKWIYDNIEEGVVVTIREDLPADQELAKSLRPPPLNTKYMRPASTPEPTPEPNYTPDGLPPLPFRSLSKGKDGEDVYWLQRKLQDLGYYKGTVTGSFYDGTQRAVKAYQKDHRIRADGVAGEKTLLSIYADVLAAGPAALEVSQGQAGTPGLTPNPVPTPAPGK